MSDAIKHECGIGLIRLLKPLSYYKEKYRSALYGFNKLFLLMEKQHNRGQDGVGMGCVKLDMPNGQSYMSRKRKLGPNCLTHLLNDCLNTYDALAQSGTMNPEDPESIKHHWGFRGEVFLGHLRYATYGNYTQERCHPYYRRSNWVTRNLLLAGNFNLINVETLHTKLVDRGQHPIFGTDTQAVLESIGYYLDEEHSRIYKEVCNEGISGRMIPETISKQLNPVSIIEKATHNWDGGFTIAGMIGNGDSFVFRDPYGIRPGHYFINDEIVAVASERVALMTIFDLEEEAVQELKPGHIFVIKKSGETYETAYTEAKPRKSCSFERIYFSRGNDPDIYKERKTLGANLAKPLCELINNDFNNTVFGYIPNTAETAYNGLIQELQHQYRISAKEQLIEAFKNNTLNEALIDELILNNWPRAEKLAIKDIKLRTFISQEKERTHLAHRKLPYPRRLCGSEPSLYQLL